MITLDLSILNQKGTPMFYSDTLALRPAFGIAGRIFIATDSPYGIYRDTGAAWVQIASAGSGTIGGSGTLNTIAMFTPSGTAIGDSAISQTGSNVTVTARNLIVTNGNFNLAHTHPAVNGLFNPFGQQIAVTNTINAGITWTALLAFFNSSSLMNNLWNGSATFGNGSYTTNNLSLSSITFNAAGATITSMQASGGIRAWANQILQLRIDGTNNGTYTHYANSAVYGDFASSTARFTITNRYGYLVNNLDEYSAGHTYTNRWAFYNAGINDNNFFAGKVGIGSGYVPSTYQLDVNGTARVSGDMSVNGSTLGKSNSQILTNNAFGVSSLGANTTGNNNIAFGYETLRINTTGSNNTSLGSQTFYNNTTGSFNTGVGYRALFGNTTGTNNSALGNLALSANTTGTYNVAIGDTALRVNTTGTGNVVIGGNAAYDSTTGSSNSALGSSSLRYNISGGLNTAIGASSLFWNDTGDNNTAIGSRSGFGLGSTYNTSGANNIFIGWNAVGELSTESNRTWIGNTLTTSTWVGGSLLVGTRTDIASSILTLASTTKGFLPPRMTSAERSAISAATGLIVYQTDGTEGLYEKTSSAWRIINGGGGGSVDELQVALISQVYG